MSITVFFFIYDFPPNPNQNILHTIIVIFLTIVKYLTIFYADTIKSKGDYGI